MVEGRGWGWVFYIEALIFRYIFCEYFVEVPPIETGLYTGSWPTATATLSEPFNIADKMDPKRVFA